MAWWRGSGSRARRDARSDAGSASLEFLVAGLVLLVPTVYLVLVLAQIQAASFAVEGATRQAARVYTRSVGPAEAQAAAARAVELALADHGLDGMPVRMVVDCRPEPADCLARRGYVSIRVAVEVPLPLLPPVIGVELPARIPIGAVSTEQVSRFRSGA